MRVLIGCTGNLCRSPMAAALMRHALVQRGREDIEVVSAGTMAGPGSPASPHAVTVLADRGVDLSEHRSRPLTRAEVLTADLVIAMERAHVREVTRLAPEAAEKVLLLNELADMDTRRLPDAGSGVERLEALLAAPRPRRAARLDVTDPYGRSLSVYTRSARDIEEAVEALVEALCARELPD
ncbi:MAG: low molecular weight protein arginine phosphatase [Actinomycetota bacterium]